MNPAIGSSSPGIVPINSPAPRRDSLEMRGRSGTTASTTNGEQPLHHGLERVIESLKIENGEAKRLIRELDDRCTAPPKVKPTFLMARPLQAS